MFLIITLCGSIYVRFVFSSFLILPFIKVGVTLANSHINSSLCFRHSWNCNSCLILFFGNKKINQILFSDWFLYQFCSISSNRYVIGADEGTRTPTPLALVPKTSASTSSATSAYIICLTIVIIAHLYFYCQAILKFLFIKIK